MIPVKHIDPDDLALYAMQLLPLTEMEEMRLNLQHSAEARRIISEIYGDLSLLAHTAEMHTPPEEARRRLMKTVAREKKATPIDHVPAGGYAPRASSTLFEEEPVKKSAAAKILPWLGWAVAAGMAFGVANLYTQREHLMNTATAARTQMTQTQVAAEAATLMMETLKDPSAVHIALTSTGVNPPPEGRASYVPEKGSLVFIASNLEPLAAYKTYELWLIPADGRDPIPAGTFHPDERGNASVVLPTLPKGVQAKAFGVTIEDGDGSQTPTLPIILKGAAS